MVEEEEIGPALLRGKQIFRRVHPNGSDDGEFSVGAEAQLRDVVFVFSPVELGPRNDRVFQKPHDVFERFVHKNADGNDFVREFSAQGFRLPDRDLAAAFRENEAAKVRPRFVDEVDVAGPR